MKNILFSFAVFIISFSASSQIGCGDPFFDNGGATGDYLPNSNHTTTICPNNAGEVVSVTFTSFDTEAGHDGLYIYNGVSSSPSNQFISSNPALPGWLPGAFWGNSNPGPFTSSSANGCLTFYFKGDAVVQKSGWTANIVCGPVATGFHLKAFLDANGNGIQDTGDYNFPLGQFQYEMNGNGSVGNITSPNGYYDFFEDNPANNYYISYTIDTAYVGMYNVTTPSFTGVNLGSSTGLVPVSFPITSLINYNDLSVNCINLSNPRAGFDFTTRLSYTNFGNQTIANGSLTFTKDTVTPILSTSEIVTNTASGFTYNFSNLSPYETRYIDVALSVPSIPTVSIGQLLTNSANIATPVTETTLTNNNSNVTEAIIGSYDPNDKTESHGEKIVYSTFDPDEYLTYTIRFENTGTAPAENVRITDVLDSAIDETSIKMVCSSNSYVLERVENILSWKLNNIQLPVSIANTSIGKGYVSFKAKLKPGFAIGTNVPNTAQIYFDTNPAIVTNTFNTEFVATLSYPNFTFDSYFSIYPNPVKSSLTISTIQDLEISSINIYNTVGQLILTLTNSPNSIDVADLKAGTYFIKIVSDKGTAGAKFIKK